MIMRMYGCEGVMDDQEKIFQDELSPEMFEEFVGSEQEWKDYVKFITEGGDPFAEDPELPFN